jgi:ABC-2 type transport system ATP-binding protein
VNVISSRHLGMQYGKRTALTDCTVEIPSGSVTALIGPNGAGKTTLLHLIAGLLKPTSGTVEVFGANPRTQPLEVLPRLGFVGQDHSLERNFSVSDMLTFGRRLNPNWHDDVAREALDAHAIPLDAKIGKLSGGQRSQVALALARAKRPDLLVLDEPVAALDPFARREFNARSCRRPRATARCSCLHTS